MDFWGKSHGHGQSSPSFSTLSPLAPPFTAGRSRPSLNHPGSGSSDHTGRSIHGRSLPGPYDSIPATFSNRVVKAEPFSRQYGEMGGGLDGGEGNCSSWGDLRVKNTGWLPTGEKAGQVPCSSTWVEPDRNGFLSNYVGYLSSEAYLASENSWHGNHANTNVKRDDTDSDCKEWLYDKPSMHVQERLVTVPTKPSCRSGGSLSIGNPSGPLTSMELCGNYLYDYLTAHPDSSQSDQVSYQNETFRSPGHPFSSATSGTNASMYKNMKHNLHLHDQPVDGFNGNDFHSHHRPSTSSTLFRPNITRKVEIKPYVAGKSKKGYEMNEIAVITISPKKEKLPKEMSVSDLKSSTKDRGISSITNLDLGNTNLTVQISAQTDNSNQISSETNDQLDLGVDSPCYKGTLAAKCSPFHVENAPLNSSFMGDMKLGDAHKRSGGLSITSDSVKKHNHSDILEIENCVSLLKDHGSRSPMKPSPRNENAISDAFAESFVENSSSDFDVAPNNSRISDSSMHGVNHSEKIAEQFEIYNSNESSNTSADAHFLIRSLHDLSKFACSYCCNATMLKKEDHKLLLMTISNLEACVSKTVKHVYQGKPSGSKKVHISETDVDGVSIQNSKHTCDGPDKMTPFKSSVNSDEIFDSNMDYKIAVAKEIEKSMKKVFFAEEENPETNLYKNRWIEAEAALCSTKCEFILDRKMAGIKSFTQQPSTAYQLSTITEEESTKEGKVGIVNSVCDHAVNNALVPNAMESTCAMAKYSAQPVIPGKHQCLVPPSFTASDGDACASIIFRHGKLKDLIPKPQSKTLKEGHALPELVHAGSSLNAKPVVPGISQDQTCMAKSNCVSNSCLLFTHEIEVANQGKEGYYGKGSFNGQCYNGEVNFVDNMVESIRKFNVDPGSSNSFQPHTLKDHQHIEGYYATKHDHTTPPDWEHVPK